MKDNGPKEPSGCENHVCGEWGVGGGSFSTPFMSRNQDISFGAGSPITCDVESPTFTCRSSFSSFLAEPESPCTASGGFSFRSCGDSNALEFSSPVPTISSFAFFSPGSAIEQGSCALEFSTSIPRVDAIQGGTQSLASSNSLQHLIELVSKILFFALLCRSKLGEAAHAARFYSLLWA